MKLAGHDGQSIEFSILGYEDPELSPGDPDASWLRIGVEVSHPAGDWHASGAWLQRQEVEQLAQWLETVGQEREAAPYLTLAEPEREFGMRTEDGERRLYVRAEESLRPKWAESAESRLFVGSRSTFST